MFFPKPARIGMAAIAAAVILSASPLAAQSGKSAGIKVVAAENIYGNIVQQIAKDHAEVLSIISDPNVDPHEYEANVNNAKSIAEADLVVVNGGGYDTWIDKLLSGAPNPRRVLITAFDISPIHLKDNEHVWYNPDNILAVSQKILDALKAKDPADSQAFDANFARLKADLQKLDQRLSELKLKHQGTPVALTETIFLYQTQLMDLKVLTPWSFEKSIAEGEDPSVADEVKAESQISQKQVKLLIVNNQTVTPITTQLREAAKKAGLPIVEVSETMPPALDYQQWMGRQLDSLAAALAVR